MHLRLLLVLLLGVVVSELKAVSFYEWDANRERYKLTEQEESYPEYILKQHAQFNYVLEDNQFLLYSTVHRIVRVNNSEAIQRNNRIYIAMNDVIDLVDLKARSINKAGKVVNFDMTNLKELKDDDTGQGFRIFAIEGVELGSEIEYFYVLKKHASLYDRVFTQFEIPVRNSSFKLTCPKHLQFDFHSYNGFVKVEKEEGGEQVNTYDAEMKDIPALKRENFSAFEANRKRIEFKLAYNTAKSNARLFTWDEAAKTFYGILTTLDKDDVKALDKYVKTLDDDPNQKIETRIRNIENKIKTSVQVNADARDESLDDVESIIKLKLASKEGITRLFLSVFDRLKIDCHPVITCSRNRSKFDESFDSWAYLDDYILYFPKTDRFLTPYVFEFRYPLIPPDFTAQKGLFIEPYTFGDVKSALATIKEIPATDYRVNTDDLAIAVGFTEDLTGNEIKMKREFGGCNATFVAPYYAMVNDTDRGKLIEELMKQTAPDPVISKWSAGTVDSSATQNFVMDVDFTSTHFIGTAGQRILFKVGELIGPQVEMYRDDKRMTDVENDFNRGYNREIRVKIPDGYEVRNPDDVKINVTYQEGDKQPFLFVSDYTLVDNEMVITIREYYKEIFAPVARYEDFRKVINAAADFNKVTLVLEKRS
jgi:Domain of Unknown Function with PDB structure (DUF3857)